MKWVKAGKNVLLVREETNPEDVDGMRAAVGILTGRGRHDLPRGAGGPRLGQVLHRRLPRTLDIDVVGKTITAGDKVFKEGDVLTLNGTRGLVYAGQLPHDRRHRRTRVSSTS